ncbi:1-acyl-sn-glycerol-3-phosphate acyltransferase alpha-like [Motacilla alba alba]|uniref:1-acyl-sn-glycerol-3-phosphate acyltransferase alpha-like n=1 Tax=Motacilla alba alba TaxID=1094192 RepID=UPI0018D55332|nr:1-acyl-sn-glycerol-3-phosphate acyltransferase alpha-like [Motacilla alba alba]
MEVTVGTAALALALLLLPLLYERCGSFRFFCKMGFYNGWILLLALLAIPLCALRGRDVENMKIIRGLMQHVKRLYGIRMVVRGAQHFPPRQPYVVVSNHQSSLDLLGMMEVLPDRCVPIAKRELLYMGAVGVVCWLGGIIFIDRKRTHDAISVMAEAAHTMLSQDVRVWVFPEGTRNHSGSMLPFKRGAFHLAVQAQVPVVPIVISSYQHFYSKRERRFTAGRCVIQVLPPLPTRGLGAADVPALTERVRAAMLDAFEALSAELRPQSDHPSDHGSDHTSDQRSDHTDHTSDHRSDCWSDQRSDHTSDHPSDPRSDHGSDHLSDHTSDHGSDHQSDHRSDRRSDHGSDHTSDCTTDHGSDQQSDHTSDHPSDQRSDPWSDRLSDHWSDHQSDPRSDPHSPRAPSDPWSDPRSDPWSDQHSPTAAQSDRSAPQSPGVTPGVRQ